MPIMWPGAVCRNTRGCRRPLSEEGSRSARLRGFCRYPLRVASPPRNLPESFPLLAEWEREHILGEIRMIYIYTRSAAERALQRSHDKTLSSDATFETVWWIGAADSYLFTVFDKAWVAYKNKQSWCDLLDGVLWVRGQTLHDPLSIVPVTGHASWPPAQRWHWVNREDIPRARPEKEIEKNGEAYDRALAGRSVITTLTEAVRVLRHEVRPDDVAELLLDRRS